MPELAKAYVQIIPSAEGIKGRLQETLGGEAESAGESSGSSFGSGFSKTVGAVAKVGAAAIGAAATAAGKMVKDAVTSYADYEQLVGGVDTLFKRSEGTIMEYARSVGKTVGEVSKEWHEMNAGADTVMRNAADAFKTAGLSANEYMETVTSFSAALLQSVGGDTKAAADLADMAIRDMSDNANKMGSSMESIQTAYQGFAKQNYTMLDNLKLGYGGTKSEMERLVADAEALNSGFKAQRDESGALALSYGDIVDAIHIVQDNMGISGTTAREAGETISGSIGMLKSAWDNLVTGIANPDADIGSLISDVVDSATVAAGNLIPAIETGLSGIGQLITGLAPVITGALPSLISSVLPGLLSTAQSLVMTVAEALIANLPLIAETGISMLMELASSISSALPELIPVAVDVISALVDTLTNPNSIESLINAALELILSLSNGLIQAVPELVRQAPFIIKNIVTALIAETPQILSAALQLIVSLGLGLIEAIPELVLEVPKIISAIVGGLIDGVKDIIAVGGQLVSGLWEGIKNSWNSLVENVKGLFGGFVASIKDLLGIASPSKVFAGIGDNMAAGIGVGFERTMSGVERDMMRAIPVPAVDVAAAGSYRFGGAAEGGVLSGQTSTDATDIIGAIMQIGNMIVEAVNNQDSGVYLDGAAVAERLYQHNQDVQLRHGATMII